MGRLEKGSSGRDIPADDTRQRPRPHSRVVGSSTGRPLTTSIAGHVFDDIERAVGFTVSPHSLRHDFGAGLIAPGVSVVAV